MRTRTRLRAWVLEDRLAPAGLLHSLFPDATGPQQAGQFGSTMAMSADYRVVGSPFCDAKGFMDSGQVHVLSAITSNLLFTLDNPTPAQSDRFGIGVAVSGKYVVVGADSDDVGATDSGAAYVFDLTSAPPTIPLYTLTNPTPELFDFFGLSVGVSGNYVVVGAVQDDTVAPNSGSIYVYDLSSGTPTTPFASIKNPTPATNDNFGISAAVSGKYVVAGASSDDTGVTDAGSAYIFDLTSGTPATPIHTLNNPSAASTDIFGRIVAISGTQVIVSAYQDDAGASNAGSAYVYNLLSGTPTVPVLTLNNPAPALNDNFGVSLSTAGKYVVVGANFDDTGATDAGSAYVYDTTSGTPTIPTFTLNNPGPANQDQFGVSVAVVGNSVIVGAHQDDIGVVNSGSVYVYDLISGTPTTPVTTLASLLAQSFDTFGNSVATAGKYVVVGSPLDDTGASGAGQVYVYDVTSATPGTPLYMINNPSPAANDQFGYSVAIAGNYLVVGALMDDVGATDAGAAYAYDLGSATPTVPFATLANPSPAVGDSYAFLMSISGSRVVIGAGTDDTTATDSGAAYVFDLTSPTPGAPIFTLNNPTPAPTDNFGASVAISGNIVAVGAGADDTTGADSGTAYVYDLASATPTVPYLTIPNPTPAPSDQFGLLAMPGKYLVVSANGDDIGATDAGSAYVFDLTSGTPAVPAFTLNNPAPAPSDNFGFGLANSANLVVVGAFNDDGTVTNAGTAYLYDLASATPTVPIDTLNNPTPLANEQFSRSVAISGNTIVAGAYQDNTQNFWAGGAYVYTAKPTTVTSVEINNGDPQRSRVTTVKVSFNQPVTFPTNAVEAFELRRMSDNAPVTLAASVANNSVTLTFTGGAVDNISLADGRYKLTTLAAKISGGYFDGDGNGVAGDNYILASADPIDPPTNIFRLFGDITGDGTVAIDDFDEFRVAYGGTNPAFDFDNDSSVAINDFDVFRNQFGSSI